MLENVARGDFLIPPELISSHLQSLVNIRPSLARQSHAQWLSDDDKKYFFVDFVCHMIKAFRTSDNILKSNF